jgi:glyoxylase-like metal-dependent hydrolase (beta-lactamase superfamily II)
VADTTSRTLLAPLAERFECWEADTTILPGLDVVHSPGHTPGSATVVLSGDDGSRAVLLGDVVHCPVELVDPEWETIADVDPALALATRARLLAELEGTPDALVGAAHFPHLRFGRLLTGTSGRRWQPVG